jgi:hypothetical protein
MPQEQYLESKVPSELYSLSLFSSSTPQGLPKPSDWELERFPFFVTRTERDGRTRFHLHMGVFDCEESALTQLAVVRAAYPWAWAGVLPKGLIEGTMRPIAIMGKSDALLEVINSLQTAPEISDTDENPHSSELSLVEEPSPEAPAKKRLHLGKVLSVRKGAGAADSIDDAKYSVQLLWSVFPIALDRVTEHDLFDEYVLYTAEIERDGRKWYALRLGFFKQAPSAMAIAKYLRTDFCSAALIPVMSQEKLQLKQMLSREKEPAEIAPEEISLLLSEP